MHDPHYRWQGPDLWLELQGKPGARRDAFGRVMGGRLQVQIAAVAEDGKATARLIAFLAEAFGVPRSAVLLRYGQASPKKGVIVHAPRRLPAEAGVSAPAVNGGAVVRPRSS
ncbi:MAG: DUF167 domain-containing protein [Burkholderiaceae bacterium]|nr:DUF167 domain-containing protein [Rhodoferax sp.]MCP5284427.1 DUF167 domain-containing protein [Burkholderiaceae bacterium]